MDKVSYAHKDVVCGAGSRHVDMGREPHDGVIDVGRAHFGDPVGVAGVGVPCRANVPPLLLVGNGGPAAACVGFDMGQDMGARWGNGHAVEVKCSMDVGPGG